MINCEIFNFLIGTEVDAVKVKEDELGFLFTPIWVALSALLTIPLIKETHVELLAN